MTNMTVEQAGELVGDDIAYWFNNAFMTRELLIGKVCWWIARASTQTAVEPRRPKCDTCNDVGRYPHMVEMGIGIEPDDDGMVPCIDCTAEPRTLVRFDPNECGNCGRCGHCNPPEPRTVETDDRYVVTTPAGFTETFDARTIQTLERLGLIEHERDGHVLEDGQGNGIGALHRFYREVAR